MGNIFRIINIRTSLCALLNRRGIIRYKWLLSNKETIRPRESLRYRRGFELSVFVISGHHFIEIGCKDSMDLEVVLYH